MDQKQICLWKLELLEPLPETLDAGAPFSITAAISSQSPLDLAGVPYKVMQDALVICEGVLPSLRRIDPDADEFDPRNGPIDPRDRLTLLLMAPDAIGTFSWRLVIPAWERDATEYVSNELDLSCSTGIHQTSLAVWDVPSPVEANARVRFKVGAKCSACCALHGRLIEVHDETGEVAARGRLGDAVWAEAEGLYWCEVVVNAPAASGLATFTTGFPANEPGAAHRGASTSLSFMVVEPARHQASIIVVEKGAGAPVSDAQVRLGFHRSATDEHGAVAFHVAPGEHRLVFWKAGYAAPEQTIFIRDDMRVIIEVEALPPKDPYARWQA